jgi:hypothetical protein
MNMHTIFVWICCVWVITSKAVIKNFVVMFESLNVMGNSLAEFNNLKIWENSIRRNCAQN